MLDCRTNRTIGFDWFFGSVSFDYSPCANYMLPIAMMKKTFLNEAQYCWLLCDVKAAMLVCEEQKYFSPREVYSFFHVNS